MFRATVVQAYSTIYTEIYSSVVSDPADDVTVATAVSDGVVTIGVMEIWA